MHVAEAVPCRLLLSLHPPTLPCVPNSFSSRCAGIRLLRSPKESADEPPISADQKDTSRCCCFWPGLGTVSSLRCFPAALHSSVGILLLAHPAQPALPVLGEAPWALKPTDSHPPKGSFPAVSSRCFHQFLIIHLSL